jgi:hypothetical protein
VAEDKDNSPWISFKKSLKTHPKTRAACRRFNVERPTMIGHIAAIWWYAAEHSKIEGELDLTPKDIAEEAMYEGDPQEFINALIDIGFLETRNERLYIYNWHEHNGKYFKALKEKREKNAQRQKEWREQQRQEGHSPTPPEPPKFAEDSDEYRLSKLLFKLMRQNNSKCKQPTLQSWAKSVDYMIRIDKRTPEEIEKVLRWSQKDSFWKGNILSTDKLREKFDQLTLQLNRTDTMTQQIKDIEEQIKEHEKEFEKARAKLNKWEGTNKQDTQEWNNAHTVYRRTKDEIATLKNRIVEIQK